MYMNSTFHSSGTASGNVEMMKTWKPIITTTADHRHGVVVREQQDQRRHELDQRAADVRQADGALRRAQVLGEVAVVQPLDRLGRQPRRVADHRRDHVGEVAAELRERRAAPHDHDQQLRRDDHVDEREEGEEDQRGQVLLAAGGEEEHLVAQAEHDQQRR